MSRRTVVPHFDLYSFADRCGRSPAQAGSRWLSKRTKRRGQFLLSPRQIGVE